MTIGNILVGQSGGPTAVINNSLYGIIKEGEEQGVKNVYGAVHGIEGILNENIINLSKVPEELIEGLRYTPGAALGGCRYKLATKLEDQQKEIKKIFALCERYNIKYFFYIGGNDSMDTADRVNRQAKEMSYDLKVIGVPKTVDNDLVLTDHCPGFGSAAKYVATSVREAGLHNRSMYTSEPVTVLETVGRNTGWLPAASALARQYEDAAPHLICLPENPFVADKFLAEVEKTYARIGGVFIVMGEGLKDAQGNYVNMQGDQLGIDSFGHPTLEGISETIKKLIETRLKFKTRIIKLDICQQSASHFASQIDAMDAEETGRAAVQAAIGGKSGYMVSLGKQQGNTVSNTGLVELNKVANAERMLPDKYIKDNFVTINFLNYVRPLIQGEIEVPLKDGLPNYIHLEY